MKKGICLKERQEKVIQLHDVGAISPPIKLLFEIANNNNAGFFFFFFFLIEIYIEMLSRIYEDHLGWLIMGKTDINYVNNCVASLLAQSDDIANLWNLGAIDITVPCEYIK